LCAVRARHDGADLVGAHDGHVGEALAGGRVVHGDARGDLRRTVAGSFHGYRFIH
jgi:hypothetical protein